MNCPRCNKPGVLAGTRPGPYGTLKRDYLCPDLHKFTTLETVTSGASSTTRYRLHTVLRDLKSPPPGPARR